MKTLISLVAWSILLSLFVWQHQQDTEDRNTLLLYIRARDRNMHVSFEPCTMPGKIKGNEPGDSVASSIERED